MHFKSFMMLKNVNRLTKIDTADLSGNKKFKILKACKQNMHYFLTPFST